MAKLPPKLYCKIERWLILNKWLIIFGIVCGALAVIPFLDSSGPLDDQLMNGIDR